MVSKETHQNCSEHDKHEHGLGCCKKNKTMQRFMETCILLLLARQTSHGYHLTEQLKSFGIEDINVSTLYRIMRKMDERGWVCSSWEKGSKGPARRVYSITQKGLDALDEWIVVFKQRRANIDLLLSKYNEIIKDTEE